MTSAVQPHVLAIDDNRSIDVQILRLRRKIEANPTEPEFIKTERGVGDVSSQRAKNAEAK
jgi:DNA-binding response OmpR family regulator